MKSHFFTHWTLKGGGVERKWELGGVSAGWGRRVQSARVRLSVYESFSVGIKALQRHKRFDVETGRPGSFIFFF